MATRYAAFEGWIEDADVGIGFEELVGATRDDGIKRIVTSYAAHQGGQVDVESTVRRAVASIAPERSHTFRAGRSGGWLDAFSREQRRRFDAVAGGALRRYGYDASDGGHERTHR